MANLSIIDKLKRSKILDLLQEGKRIDDRALDEPRPLVIDIGVIPHANGSARVRLGDTEIVSGIKIDLSQFVLEKDKSVIGLFADSVVTDHDGNLFDACSYASVAAIITSKIPKWEMKDDIPVLIENQESDAPITTIPISVTMGRIGEFIIVDPNIDEWGCLDARITITTNSDGNIVALQKGGSDGFTFEQLVKCSELSIAVGKKIRETVKQATEGGQ